MLTDWQRERRSKVVPLQTWWSNSWSKYIPPYKLEKIMSSCMVLSWWWDNVGGKWVLRKPQWPATVPSSSRRCRWPKEAAHVCSPGAGNWGTGLPMMSLSIPDQQTGKNQKVEMSRCFCAHSANLFWLSSMFSWYLTVQSKQNDHGEETHRPHVRQGHHGHSTWVDDECQPRPYAHKHRAEKKDLVWIFNKTLQSEK